MHRTRSASGVTSPEGNYAGTYSVTQPKQGATYAPALVPAPIPDDNSDWAWVSLPPSGSSDALLMDVTNVGAHLTFAMLDHQGEPRDDTVFGTVVGDGTFSASRTRTIRRVLRRRPVSFPSWMSPVRVGRPR